jgi:hypothetical protein
MRCLPNAIIILSKQYTSCWEVDRRPGFIGDSTEVAGNRGSIKSHA